MNHSDSISKISPALVKAWANIGAALKDSTNPHFKSKFASLEGVIDVVKKPLLEQGIAVLQPVASDEHGDYVETILLHESGEWISGRMKLACAKQNDPQAMASAVTYNRRYGLQSICFVPSTDDDGESAQGRPQTQRTDPNSELQAARKGPDSW